MKTNKQLTNLNLKTNKDLSSLKIQQKLKSTLPYNNPKSLPPHNLLKCIPQTRQSIPYRLHIKKLTNLPSISKKSNLSLLFLHLSINFYVKKTNPTNNQTQIIMINNQTIHNQCQQSLFKKQQNKFQFPILFYYHSKIDKNSGAAFFVINVKIVEIKNFFVQAEHNIGFFVIENPFIQSNQKGICILKDNISQLDYVFQYQSNYDQMKKNSNVTGYVDFQIQSYMQLKALIKIIPQNHIKTSYQSIIGINQNFLPNYSQFHQIIPSASLVIKIKYLQIHIPQKFQIQLLTSIKKLPNSSFLPKDQIKSRKLIVGFWNRQTLLKSVIKQLNFLQRQKNGQWKISIYQAIKDQQVINITYFLQQQAQYIAISMIYQIGDKQIEVAQYYFIPIINSNQNHDISQQMIINNFSAPLKAQYIFESKCIQKPTLILQYSCQDILLQTQKSMISLSNHEFNRSNIIGLKQSQLGNSYKFIQDKTQRLKQQQRLIQQIQRQKLLLEKQKNQIARLKTSNYVHYHDQFEKKFDQQKQNLLKRQQLLERQYKQQVQRQIMEKLQLQEEIRQMKQKLRKIQDPQIDNQNMNSGQRYNNSGYGNNNKIYRSYQTNQIDQQNFNPRIIQRIDPTYLIQNQNSIPTIKVRQMIKKQKINQQTIEISKNKYNRASKFTFTFSSIIWLQEINQPKTFYFIIRFFNFSQYKSQILTYLQSDNQQGYSQLVKFHHFTHNLQNATPQYTFTIDPSYYKNPKLIQQDLINYLTQNNCIIDIFDGQTHIYLGQLNIKLHQLIRGNKSQTLIAKQYSLIKIKTKQTYGLIQLLIKNQQTFCKSTIDLKNNANVKDIKTKVVSLTPMNIPETNKKSTALMTTQKINQGNHDIKRIQDRITKFKERQKQKKILQSTNNFRVLPQNQKSNILKRITSYKQKTMPDYIKNVYSNLLHQNITISAQFGKATTFPYTFVNQSNTAASYKIVVHISNNNKNQIVPKALEGKLNHVHNDLQVIKQSSQWRYYVKKRNYMQPKYYEIINDQNIFYLNAGQSLPMVFKYLTFTNNHQNKQDIIINVVIVKLDNNWMTGGFSLKVQLHQPVIHHSYILYQPGNQIVDLILPVIYSKTDEYSSSNKVKKLHLTSQNAQTQAQWLNQYQILLRIATPEIMHKQTFNLLLYDDQYFDQLKQNWLIVVNSYEGIWAQSRPDSRTKFKISLPFSTISKNLGLDFYSNSLSNSLILNSSDPCLIFENQRLLVEFTRIQQQGAYQIWCQVLANQNIKKEIQITCTSQENHRLIYGWTVQILSYTVRRN